MISIPDDVPFFVLQIRNFTNQLGLAMMPSIIWMAMFVIFKMAPDFSKNPIKEWDAVQFYKFGGWIIAILVACANALWWGAHFFAQFAGFETVAFITWFWGQAANIFTRYLGYNLGFLSYLIAGWMVKINGIKPPSYYIAGIITLTCVTYALLEFVKQ